MTWLARFLFTHARQTDPDGRPLYAYKMTEAAYMGLLVNLRQELAAHRDSHQIAPTFCLYAAETFCREHAGGPWAWETVFRPLCLPAPPQARIGDWVEQGLRWWQRPLLQGAAGQRLFLVSIACEGGLPLRLLHQENAHLTQFFRNLLESYYRTGQNGTETATGLARQQFHRLPRSLRHDPVFHLAGALIAKITDLQPRFGSGLDPIAALDQQVPDWRRDLPLRLNDQVAESLLTGLVHRSGELAQAAKAKLRWRGAVRASGIGWQVERRLEFPETLTSEQVAGWIRRPASDRPRWRLLLETAGVTSVVAWLTLVQDTGRTLYRREWLRQGGVALTGAAVTQAPRLCLSDGLEDHALAVEDQEPWGPSPWVFVEHGRTGERDWLTEGSARTRADRAWVLAPPDLTPREVMGRYEPWGRVTEVNRVLYRVSGQVELLSPEQDCYRFICGAETDTTETFVLDGNPIPQVLQERPLYRGLPVFRVIDAEGRHQASSGTVEWHRVGDGGPWRPRIEPAHGRLWLHATDQDGAERCRRCVDVAPADFKIEADIGTGGQAGTIWLSGLAGAEVVGGPETPPGVSITRTGDQAKILCPALSGTLLPPLMLNLRWPESQPIPLALAYPQRGAFFELAGRPLRNDDWIALERLGGLRLFVQDPAGGRHYWLRGDLPAEGFQPFHERLPPLENGRIEVSLYRWQERIESLLASIEVLEAQVRLDVETAQGQRLARVRVSRYDAMLEPDLVEGRVRVSEDSLARLGSDWGARTRLEMLRLWAPADDPVPLQPSRDGAVGWEVPPDLEPGPWWVIGRDGDWARFRPLLLVVASEDPPMDRLDASLATAIREPDPERRRQAVDRVLITLGQDPDHRDWSLLFDFIRMAREFPASSLDVLCRLVAHPRTLVQALFRVEEQSFDAVWSLSTQMPFLWILVPITDWLEAATRYFGGLDKTLCEIDGGEEIVYGLFQGFRERASVRRLFFRPLCDWLQEWLFPLRILPSSSELKMARMYSAFLEQEIGREEQALMSRHDADERWPTGDEVIAHMDQVDQWMQVYHYAHLAEFYRPVRCAPFVCASWSLHGIEVTEQPIYQMRILRGFDREWFDRVHAIALTIGLTRLAQNLSAQES